MLSHLTRVTALEVIIPFALWETEKGEGNLLEVM